MRAVLLTVGDELLIGQVLNTNAAWLGEQLTLIGVEVVRSSALPDEVDLVTRALRQAADEAELVIVTGGLGPTHDDVTRDALADFAGVALQTDPSVLAAIRERFVRRGRQMPERNAVQALVPEGFEVLANPVGTAPGLWRAIDHNGHHSVLVALPGVPHEMEYLVEHEVVPRLRTEAGLRVIRQRTLLTAGIGESHLQERLGDLSPFLSANTRLAYLPGPDGVRLRLTVLGEDPDVVRERLEQFSRYIASRIAEFVYGHDADTLEAVVGAMLSRRGKRLAIAESCTGGNLLDRITAVPGASSYLIGGVVAYCNEVKKEVLGVVDEVLDREGAVSRLVAIQMAEGVRRRLGTDIGISTTGIAGPGGGSQEKPVGLVWIGYADDAESFAVSMQFGADRALNKQLASSAALNLLRKRLRDTVDS